MVIAIHKQMLSKRCIIFCTHCGIYTTHALAQSQEFYACYCGTIVEIEVIEDYEDETK